MLFNKNSWPGICHTPAGKFSLSLFARPNYIDTFMPRVRHYAQHQFVYSRRLSLKGLCEVRPSENQRACDTKRNISTSRCAQDFRDIFRSTCAQQAVADVQEKGGGAYHNFLFGAGIRPAEWALTRSVSRAENRTS